jgi:7,8-dihydropterin-6-yl-methyl-4-(beta-D-ribofuranosyl)aminobenzene 5'-phosphate synthase
MDDALQVTILKDNTAARPGVAPGHGLAMLVEIGGRRVLFDTGPDDSLVANAQALGLSLYPLEAIVLSHGHVDHTGGLAAVLDIVGPVKVVAHPDVFDRTFAGPEPGELREIGLPLTRAQYEARGARFALSALPTPVIPGLLSTGRVPPVHAEPQLRTGLWRSRAGELRADDARDDCSLVAQLPGCTVVLTGCAHPGLTNVLCKVKTIAPEQPPCVVVGGLHLGASSDEQVTQLAREAAELGVCIMLPCHCTGARATEVLTERFAGRVVPVGTGSVIRVHEDGETEVRYPVEVGRAGDHG